MRAQHDTLVWHANPGEQDSEELLRNLHLAPYAKPVVSLVDDFPMVQKHKGWQFGYISDNTTRRMTCARLLRFILGWSRI